jgi:hypothetical protein
VSLVCDLSGPMVGLITQASARGLLVIETDLNFAASAYIIIRSTITKGDETMKNVKMLICVAVCLFLGAAASVAQTPKPKRINRGIELLEQGQPIYYAGSHSGNIGTFEQGKQDAQTWADYISYDMEAAPYDIVGLAAYMQSLAAGGPTRTGHLTPTVIVNVPVRGTDEATVRANAWMFEQ